MVPLSASVTLIGINWTGYYIGKELEGPDGKDDLKFLGLQFGAKILELLAVASLSTIMLTLVRTQLMSDSLPFGAVTAGYEFNKLSFLWSKGFVATCTTKFMSSGRKTLLITAIVTFAIPSTTIGPSAAVAALPVLRDWPAGGTSFWLNATEQALWPLRLDKVAPADLPCISAQDTLCFPGNHNTLADGLLSLWPLDDESGPDRGGLAKVMPEKILISGRESMHTMQVRFRGPFVYQPELTVATTPMSAVSDASSNLEKYWFLANAFQCHSGRARFCYYKDFSCSIMAKQPVTYVKCSTSNISETPRFPRLENPYPLVDYVSDNIGTREWFDQSTGNGSHTSLSWVDLPEADFGATSIGAVVALPGTDDVESYGQALFCTVDARWAPSNASVSFSGGPDMVSGTPENEKWYIGGRLQRTSSGQPLWPHIQITPAWADAINQDIPEAQISGFEMLCNSVGRLNDIAKAPFAFNAVESILAVMLTESLARTGSLASILGSLKGLDDDGWTTEILPTTTAFGDGGSAFDYSPKEGDSSTRLEMRTTVLGYGYGITTATLLSTIVLLVYSLIAIVYIIHSTYFSKTTSSAWESITDLVALAVNSKSSPSLQNTGVGIATLGVFKQPVKIRVSNDHLELIFGHAKSVNKVHPNEYYG